MNLRKLGKHDFMVSEVGLGSWQLGGDWGSPISKETAFLIMKEAVDQGITFFDTADVYGAGKSERVIGEFIKAYDPQIKIATKFGRGSNVFPNNYSEAALRKSVNESKLRLGVDSIDLLQLHCIPTSVLKKGDIFNWLRKLKKEGLIKEFGASVETIEEGLICLNEDKLALIQVIFNVFRQQLIKELLPKAKEKGVGVIVRLPLASGLLTGKFSENTKFSENDHRFYNRNGDAFNVGETFAGLPFEKGVELSRKIKNELLPAELTMVQLALRWILDHDAVSCVIPGASNPSQAKMNAGVSNLNSLSPELHQTLHKFYTNHVHEHIRGAY